MPLSAQVFKMRGPHAALYCTLNKSGQNTQAERGFVKYSDTNTNSGRGDFRKERNFTNHNGFRFPQGKSATSGTGNPQLMELGKTPIKVDNLRNYLKIYPNRDDAFELGAAIAINTVIVTAGNFEP